MKDAIVAKLCSQCDEMFGDALKHLQRESLKSLWERDWISRVAGKQAGYHALAEYYQSRVSILVDNFTVNSCILHIAVHLVTCKRA